MLNAIAALAVSFTLGVAANTLPPPPLALIVAADKTTYAPGDTVRLEATITNRSSTPIVLAKPIWDGAPAGAAGTTIKVNGKAVTLDKKSSMPLAQVMVSGKVAADRFVALKPGASLVIYWETFEKRWVLKGSPGLKLSYNDAPKVLLEPGVYTVTATYGFDRDYPHEWPTVKVTGTAEAMRLYHAAFTGRLTATTSFTVARR